MKRLAIISILILWYPKLLNISKAKKLELEREISERIKQLISEDKIERRRAFDWLLELGKRAQPQLLSAVRLGKCELQVETVKVLDAMSDPDLLNPFVELARQSTFPETRYEIANALGKLKDKSATPALIHLLECENSVYVKRKIIWAFGEIKDYRATDILIKLLNDPSYYLREAVINALGNIGDEKAVEPLINRWKSFTKDSSPGENTEIAKAFGKLKSEKAVYYLTIELVGSPSIMVRRASAKALGEIGDRNAIYPLITALLDESPGVFSNAHKALVKIIRQNFYEQGETIRQTQKLTQDKWLDWFKKHNSKFGSAYCQIGSPNSIRI